MRALAPSPDFSVSNVAAPGDVQGFAARACRKVDLKQLGEYQPFRREIVRQKEVRAQGPMLRGGYDVVFEIVARSETQNTNRFHANILIRGRIGNRRVRLIGDGAGKNVCRAAAGVRDVNRRNLDLLKGAVVVEIQTRELANAQLIVDVDAGVNFFPPVAVGLNANLRVEQADFGGKFGSLVTRSWRRAQRWVLPAAQRVAGRGAATPRSQQRRAERIAAAIRRRGIILWFTVSSLGLG